MYSCARLSHKLNWVKRWLPLARKFGLRVGTRQEQLANSRMEPAILGPMQEQQLPAAENEALSKKGPKGRTREGDRERTTSKGKAPRQFESPNSPLIFRGSLSPVLQEYFLPLCRSKDPPCCKLLLFLGSRCLHRAPNHGRLLPVLLCAECNPMLDGQRKPNCGC